MKYCPYCGTQLQDDMIFCRKCGRKYPSDESNELDSGEATADGVNLTGKQDRSNVVCKEAPATGDERPQNKNRNKMVLLFAVAICAVAILSGAIVMIASILARQKPSEDNAQPAISSSPQSEQSETSESTMSIAEASESVLYLEIYDNQDELVGTASGFLVEDHSTLVTNYHVMEDAYHIVAWTADGEQSQEITEVIAYDDKSDLAILRCSEKLGISPLTLGDSNLVSQGDAIYVVGYPLGLSNTLSDGIISSCYFDENNIDILQITAPISGGSSGGALLNQNGEVVGVISASYVDGQNINIAVASNMLAKLLESPSEPVQLSDIYEENHKYGNIALNVSSAPFLAESKDFYYYVDEINLYLYDKTTKESTSLDRGRYPNVYKGKLYYVAFDENDLCCADLDGTNKTLFGIIDTSNHTDMSWSHDRSILNLLVAENKIFLCIIDHTNENWPGSLYVYDINSLDLLFSLDNTSSSFVYYGNTLYIGTESRNIYAVDMRTLDYELYSTSCVPNVGGIDGAGNVYYTDMYNEFAQGVYKLEIPSGKETIITAVKGSDAGHGKGYDFFVLKDVLHFCEFTLSEARNSIGISDEANIEWGDQNIPIYGVNSYWNNKYLYMHDGTTIDAESGEIVGTWVFE